MRLRPWCYRSFGRFRDPIYPLLASTISGLTLTSDVRAMQRQPLFESITLPVLEDVIATFTQRGTEYSDTWANGKWSAVRQTHEFIGASIRSLRVRLNREL